MTTEDKLQEFAFYALYKTTPSKFEHATIDEKIRICANLAYYDFCRTVKYNHSKKGTKKYTDKEWKGKVKQLLELFFDGKNKNYIENTGMIDAINDLINSENADEYNEKHKNICQELTSISSPILEEKLSIGQAQKWVNMTVKHLWLNDLVKCDAAFLHVPIDNYILGELFGKVEKIDKSLVIRKESEQYKVKQDRKFVSWSQISDYDNCYIPIQKVIERISEEKTQTSIEWEYGTWLTAAQGDKA